MIENGKLFVLGASLASWWMPVFPGVASPVLAVVIEADRDLDAGAAEFVIRATDAKGREISRGEVTVQITGPDTPGWPWILPFIAQMQIQAAEPGPIDITIGNDAGIDARIPLILMPPTI